MGIQGYINPGEPEAREPLSLGRYLENLVPERNPFSNNELSRFWMIGLRSASEYRECYYSGRDLHSSGDCPRDREASKGGQPEYTHPP